MILNTILTGVIVVMIFYTGFWIGRFYWDTYEEPKAMRKFKKKLEEIERNQFAEYAARLAARRRECSKCWVIRAEKLGNRKEFSHD